MSSLAVLVFAAGASGAVGGRSGAALCSPARLYFEGSYFRTVKLSSPLAAGRRAGIGTYVPCNATGPVQTPLRRLRGVRAAVGLRDAADRHLLYVEGTLCSGRRGRTLLRCLRHAKPHGLIVPPPAFAIADARYTPLGYTSSCWTTTRGAVLSVACAEYAWPPSSPTAVTVEPGGQLTFQLGFQPNYVALFLHRTETEAETIQLPASTLLTWQVPENLPLPMLFELRALGPDGEGAYVGQLVGA